MVRQTFIKQEQGELLLLKMQQEPYNPISYFASVEY